jgi:hypothetical protein
MIYVVQLSVIEKSFIQQVVYGWFREKAGIEAFMDNFFSDCAAMVSRADKGLYTVIAYIAIFRLDEIGWHHFKEFVITQDPTKMSNIISYLFNTVSDEVFCSPLNLMFAC